MSNINDTYFDGYYKDIWKALIPAELTVKEVDFMMQYFNLQPGDRVLDIMCGYGRHALALAEKGMEVTAVDNLGEYIDEIKNKAAEKKLPVKALQHDIATYEPEGLYDLVICMGNSLNFFDAEHTQKIFHNVSSHLKQDGYLLINSWSIAEIVIRQYVDKSWTYVIDFKFLSDSKFLFNPTRIESETIIIDSTGDTQIKKAVDYIFSLNEMHTMLTNAGLAINHAYNTPGKRDFVLGNQRIYLVCKKNTK